MIFNMQNSVRHTLHQMAAGQTVHANIVRDMISRTGVEFATLSERNGI